MAGRVAALALAGGVACYDADDFEGDPADLITLQTEDGRASLPADGFSTVTLVAVVAGGNISAKREVQFQVDRGSFFGDSDGDRKVTLALDQDQRARVELRSDTTVGVAQVTAAVVGHEEIRRTLALEFVAPNPDDVMVVVSAPTSAPADEATRSPFVVRVNAAIAGAAVAFETTAGTFANGTRAISVVADAERQAAAEVISPSAVSSGIVSARISGVTRTMPISFEPALPDLILVVPDALSVGAGKDVRINGQLRRQIGKVTPGTIPTFGARDAAGNVLGGFLSIEASNAQGQVAARYLPGSTSYRGPVEVTVGAVGTAVTGTTVIQVIDP